MLQTCCFADTCATARPPPPVRMWCCIRGLCCPSPRLRRLWCSREGDEWSGVRGPDGLCPVLRSQQVPARVLRLRRSHPGGWSWRSYSRDDRWDREGQASPPFPPHVKGHPTQSLAYWVSPSTTNHYITVPSRHHCVCHVSCVTSRVSLSCITLYR